MNKLLSAENVSIFIGNISILRDVNLTISAGDFIFLKGKNGSGKSILLKTLAHQAHTTPCTIIGNIYYKNALITDVQAYRRKIYFIPQIQEDYGESVLERFFEVMNVLHDPVSKEMVTHFLETHMFNSLFPNYTIAKLLIKKYGALSEGQKKIIDILCGIMRAGTMDILFIDEPLNHLDSGNIKNIIDLLQKLRQEHPNLAIMMTTHCQAFPEPSVFLHIDNQQVMPSPLPYIHYNCFADV